MSERGKQIARQWQREIDDEIRRAAAREREPERWRALSWLALWLVWLALLLAVIVRVDALH